MDNQILESQRLLLKSCSLNELAQINRNQTDMLKTPIEPDALTGSIQSAIAKKMVKMQNTDEALHNWYTYWLMIDKTDGTGIGFIGFKGPPDSHGLSEVGYGIAAGHRSKGLTTEALKTLTGWASQSQASKGIWARVLKTNISSIKVLRHCGFQLFGELEHESTYVFNFR